MLRSLVNGALRSRTGAGRGTRGGYGGGGYGGGGYGGGGRGGMGGGLKGMALGAVASRFMRRR